MITAPRTLADRLVKPGVLSATVLVLGGALFTALLAQVSIPLPFTPVPVTLQTFAVLTTGATLGARKGALSLLVYALVGMAGAPVFAGGTAGASTVLGPLGGYLIGFVVAAYLVGLLAERGWDRDGKVLLAMVIGEVAMYAIAVPWLGLYLGMAKAVTLGFLPFVIGDTLKLLVASGLLPLSWKLVGRSGANV